ncbi:hypothetical protein [Nocardioides sp. AX2bis]|uniref:hypothetical protein n=1 Tax=Nocardioides sp. AX2bis TaxID=2653157 RepID=UPI0012EF45D6|nr:hypothetical protein [Nocardioides sp. AX2bis]VXB47867.1 hypothetical protein NOCARDAX2BIS_230046 [Nocardioides sp. AX2bis]
MSGEPGESRSGPRTAVVAVVALVLVVVLVVLLRGGGDDADGPTSDGPTLVPATPPSAPVRLPDPGAYVDARVQPDGSVDVTHWLRPAQGVDEVTLAAYPTLKADGRPSVTDLQVQTSLGEVRLPEAPRIATDPVTVPLVRSSLLVVLTYTLDGVTDADGTVPGRALVDSVLADVDYPGEDGDTRVQVGGRKIESLACVPDPRAPLSQVVCGAEREGGWAVNLAPRQLDDKVIAQVDLDREQKRNPDAGVNLD